MISDARGGHVSPGVYTEVRDVTYSTKSLGITTLGIAGETLKGPAFQPISIASWTDFTDYFGGTSTIKFKGTNYPKYELPYVAKAYLNESKQLEVVRVLGLSGYWAGSAFTIYAGTGSSKEMPVVVLRSKKTYDDLTSSTGICEMSSEAPKDIVKSITLTSYTANEYGANCEVTPSSTPVNSTAQSTYDKDGVISVDLGKFALKIVYVDPEKKAADTAYTDSTVIYNISMNQSDPDYIYKLFPEDPLMGSAPVYIEAVYDMALYKKLYDAAYDIVTATGWTPADGTAMTLNYSNSNFKEKDGFSRGSAKEPQPIKRYFPIAHPSCGLLFSCLFVCLFQDCYLT